MPDAPDHLDAATTILLVMDYQPAIVGRLPDPEAQLSLTERLIAAVREKGAHVGYVRVASPGRTWKRCRPTAQLQALGVETIVLAGISTSGVTLSTVRDGADRDYRVIVLSDASADPDPEVHEFLTTRVFPRQASVMTADELLARLG